MIIDTLAEAMLQAGRENAAARWPAVREVAEGEFRKLAQTLAEVQRMHGDGEIDDDRARQLVQMQKRAAVSVLNTVTGLGARKARDVIGAATRAAGTMVNNLIGFELL